MLESFSADIYARMGPLTYDEANQQYALANFLGAIGEMFQLLDDYGRDQMVGNLLAPGWSQVMDINRAPAEVLPWLGQFVGVSVDDSLSEALQRQQIRSVAGWNRGTLNAMIAAAQLYLVGTKSLIVRERDASACPSQPAYGITFISKTAETPNPTLVLNALMAQKPAGLVLVYEYLAGQDYQKLYTDEASYQATFTTYPTYNDVLLDTY